MSDDKFQHTSHDLALVQDWLDAKGYSGEAKTVMDAMDLIASLRADKARLREVLAEGHAALSWMLIEGMDEVIPETCPDEYTRCCDAASAIDVALAETGGGNE